MTKRSNTVWLFGAFLVMIVLGAITNKNLNSSVTKAYSYSSSSSSPHGKVLSTVISSSSSSETDTSHGMNLKGKSRPRAPALPSASAAMQLRGTTDEVLLEKNPSNNKDVNEEVVVPEADGKQQQDVVNVEARSSAVVAGTGGGLLTPMDCPRFVPISPPLSGLEQEIVRIWDVAAAVMAEVDATYWPTDGTLLGLMRNGRVATDRDIDLQVHTTRDKCQSFLTSLRPLFAKRCSLQSFKVVSIKHQGKKIGRYAMVRMHRKYGSFSTGVDFNCVYTDEPDTPYFFTHRGIYTPVPSQVFPLGKCAFYGNEVPCPKDGYAVLASLKPRYDGCMAFPHCMGNPEVSRKKCLTPHPVVPMSSFIENTRQLSACGYTSLAAHLMAEPACRPLIQAGEGLGTRNCQKQLDKAGGTLCFLQSFKG